MDEEQKKAALVAADQKITSAQQALDAAKAELKTAQEAKDEAKITAAQSKVTTAEGALSAANAEKSDLEASDVEDIVNDATKPSKLKDGTDGNKPISVPKDKFDDLNEKAKLFEQFGPLLAKVKNDPTLLERLMASDDPNQDVHARLKKLEEGIAATKRDEIKSTIKTAIATWPTFKSKYEDLKPILAGLLAQGVPYAEAVQRSFFAVEPEAATQGKRLVEKAKAVARENDRGRMGPGGGGGAPIVGAHQDDEYTLNDADREFAQKAGVDPKLYSKHADWIEKFKDL